MSMKYNIISAEVKGTYALLQHKFSANAEADLGKATRSTTRVDRGTPRDQAEECAYRLSPPGAEGEEANGKGQLYLPGAAIMRLLREAGSTHKQRGSRKSVKHLVPAAVLVLDEAVLLFDPESRKPIIDFEVDARSAVIPSTKGRVMRFRPRIEKWLAAFRLRIDVDVLPEVLIKELLDQGGQQLGLGDFRPEKGGPFGTFTTVLWKNSSDE